MRSSNCLRTDAKAGIGGVIQFPDTSDPRQELAEQRQTFDTLFWREQGHSGYVAAGPSQARYQACSDRISSSPHQYRDAARGVLSGPRGGRSIRDDEVYFSVDEFLCGAWEIVETDIAPINKDVFSDDPTNFRQGVIDLLLIVGGSGAPPCNQPIRRHGAGLAAPAAVAGKRYDNARHTQRY